MGIGSSGPQPHTKVLEDVWHRTVSLIPTDIGKIAYLASLRDPNSGQYRHYGLETVYSADQADLALRQAHLDVFYVWLRKNLADQKEDVEHYFRTVEGDLETILENWESLEPYRGWIPLEADAAGRKLFLDDLALVIDLLAGELFPRLPGTGA